MKGIFIVIGMIIILSLGIGYLIITDPDNEQRAVFALVLEEFKQRKDALQEAFRKNETLPPSQESVSKHYLDKTGNKVAIPLYIIIQTDKMTVDFVDASGDESSVEFEPIVKIHKKTKKKSYKWICSGGTMLLRFRSKPCRTLNGFSFQSL